MGSWEVSLEWSTIVNAKTEAEAIANAFENWGERDDMMGNDDFFTKVEKLSDEDDEF